MNFVYEFLQGVSSVVWGPIMLVMLIGTGMYLTISLRFYPFRNWYPAFKCLWKGRKHQSEDGEISPWNALMTALAADIGTGNIIGVATAITVGGPGALFWMWMTAFVGMATKFSEIMLSVHFREKTPAGNWVGGAMYFIRNGLGENKRWLATAFAFFGMVASFGIGAMVQANSISVNLAKTIHIPEWVIAFCIFIFAGAVIIGGVKRIGNFSGSIVPFMALVYVIMSLAIIVVNIGRVPEILWLVISDAFTPTAAQGGFAGASIMLAIQMGTARGIFSNEAGLGSASIAHSASTAQSSLVQASIGMLDVFIDTIIICSMTGFVILISVDPSGQPLWCSNIGSGIVTSTAFQYNIPIIGEYGVSLCLTLFAFTTLLGWVVYGERCVIYLFGDKGQKPFRIVYVCASALGAIVSLDLVWLLADIANAMMAFPNIIGIVMLSPVLFKIVRAEVEQDPRFKF